MQESKIKTSRDVFNHAKPEAFQTRGMQEYDMSDQNFVFTSLPLQDLFGKDSENLRKKKSNMFVRPLRLLKIEKD